MSSASSSNATPPDTATAGYIFFTTCAVGVGVVVVSVEAVLTSTCTI